MIVWASAAVVATAFVIAALAVPLTRRMAHRFGLLDVPGRHKMHARAAPLLGGTAIFAAVVVPSMFVLAMASIWSVNGAPSWLPSRLAVHVPGVAARAPMALGILLGAFVLHVVGIIDDARMLGAWLKLLAQAAVAVAVVLLCNIRVLQLLGEPWSAIVTVLWLVAITNAFNFMDNMDGLSAGVAAIVAGALLATAASVGQLFVAGWACLILGASLGFLVHNFPPASTFMGDAGSMVLGFLLGVVSCLVTYVRSGATASLFAVVAPLPLMAVPLYDMASVVFLRLRARQSPLVGDRRHFSHRLAKRGLSARAVAATVYLCTAATAMSAVALTQVKSNVGACLLLAQTAAILAIIAVLESSGN